MARRVRRVVADDAEVVDDAETVHRSVERAPFSPAQIVALIVGAILAILGGVSLAKTGVDFNDLARSHEKVAGMDQTAILGIGELVVGLFLIGAGAIPGGARATMTFFGVVLLGAGIVVLVSDTSAWMHKWLTVDNGVGWFFVVLGAVLLLAAMLAPVIFGTDRQAVGRRAVVER
ncbi:MAG: hypothetical protein H0W70_07235 [Actinobacteria bacterium]|nr:hypothetical protein [Actinomycetota bacterium]